MFLARYWQTCHSERRSNDHVPCQQCMGTRHVAGEEEQGSLIASLRCNVFLSGRKKQPKDKVFGQDIPDTLGTQMSGYPGQKLYASGLFSVVLDKEWPGCPGIWVGTSQIWKYFMRENSGLIFRSLFWNPRCETCDIRP